MREETKKIVDAINQDLDAEFDRELTQVLIKADVENANGREYYCLGAASMDTAKEMLIEAAKKGSFAQWVATNPEELKAIYEEIPSAQDIITMAEETQLKALIALDNWDHVKHYK